MGCFNTRGFLSHTTIRRGDEIVAFVCKFGNNCGRYFYYPLEAYMISPNGFVTDSVIHVERMSLSGLNTTTNV